MAEAEISPKIRPISLQWLLTRLSPTPRSPRMYRHLSKSCLLLPLLLLLVVAAVISNETPAVEKAEKPAAAVTTTELVTVSNERTTYANLFKTTSTELKPASAVAGSPKL
jgi:hypothetical protein